MSANNNIAQNKKLKENPFEVPSNYFETLDAKLIAIAGPEPKVVSLNSKRRTNKILAIAATLLILITATWFGTKPANQVAPELTTQEIMSLVEVGYLEPTEMQLLEVVTLDDLNQMDLVSDDLYEYYESTQPELVEDYYLYEDI